jgi:hypothetical protein
MNDIEQRVVVYHANEAKQAIEIFNTNDIAEGWRIIQMQTVTYGNNSRQISCCVVLWMERPSRKAKEPTDETNS